MGLRLERFLVAEGEIVKEVFEGLESLGGEDGGAGGADAFEVGEPGCRGRRGNIRKCSGEGCGRRAGRLWVEVEPGKSEGLFFSRFPGSFGNI